ncbi:MAG: signal peptide peptidase SppA [Rikenellaceae bacterium]|nr:signal peptide peptidase SppA [Rikenellaceae bacterium]
MNSFFKTFFAALLAFVVGGILIGIFAVMTFAGLAAMFSAPVATVGSNAVLKIDLAEQITDSPISSPLRSLDLRTMRVRPSYTLLEALTAIEAAADDDRIAGIYLNVAGGSAGVATLQELRGAVSQFKESGKFVVGYSDFYTQGSYYFTSVADRVWLNPEGTILWQGLASNVMFYKGLLDKLGVRAEVVRHGSYKAAVEPFILDRMSPENREQTTTLLGSIWGSLLSEISASRGIDSALLQNYASDLALRSASAALEYGFVDSLLYNDQVDSLLVSLSGGTGREPEVVTLGQYIAGHRLLPSPSANQVAVVYADGQIIDGPSVEEYVGGQTVAAQLARARTDDRVKAVVLRVNSPGGSALASEVIWREVELIREQKPVVVSMGDVAASGGYYISCPADIILASPATITGSIGVFGLLFDAGDALRNKLGITVDVARTNPSADMGVPFRPLSAAERDYLQYQVESVYGTFIGHVAAGRNLSVARVDEIGGGRVWSGVSAREIGLVDGFGGLKTAILLAADRAGIADDFSIREVSEPADPLTEVLRSLSQVRAASVESELGLAFREYSRLQRMLGERGAQAIMPYTFDIH